MGATCRYAGALLVLGTATAVVADPQNAEHATPTLPELKIKGDSAGSAKLSLGVSLTTNDSKDRDRTLSAAFTTKTADGVSNLVSFDAGTSKAADWGADLAVSWVMLPEFKAPTQALLKARAAAWNACAQACKIESTDLICQITGHFERRRAALDTAKAHQEALADLELRFLENELKEQCMALRSHMPAKEADKDHLKQCDEAFKSREPKDTPESYRDRLGSLLLKLSPGPTVTPDRYVDDRCKGPARPADASTVEPCNDIVRLTSDRGRARKALAEADKAIESVRPAPGYEPTAVTLEPEQFCKDGLALIEKAGQAYRDQRAARPDGLVSFGVHLGKTTFAYLQPDSMSEVLRSKSTREGTETAALAVMFRPSALVDTVEIPLLISSHNEPSSKSARWCVPVGQVPRGDGSGSDVAESCSERALGAPKSVTALQGSVLLGMNSRDGNSYRLSGGLLGRAQFQDQGDASYAVGLEFPLYFDANLLPDDKGVFKGILRVTPSVLLTRDLDGTKDTKFLVTLELLTGRSMYPGATDLL